MVLQDILTNTCESCFYHHNPFKFFTRDTGIHINIVRGKPVVIQMIQQALANPIVSQFAGLIIGLFTSFFSWWVLFRWMAPTITLSDAISKTSSRVPLEEDDDKSGVRYRIKFENSGRRPIIDLEVQALVRIKGLVDPQSTIWEVVHLPMETDGEKVYSIPLMNPVRTSKLRTRLRICPNHTKYCARPQFPPHIREKATKKELLLEDLLSLGTSSQLRVIISGFDELTGSRKLFMKTYLPTDIKFGEFERNSLAIAMKAPNIEDEGVTPQSAHPSH